MTTHRKYCSGPQYGPRNVQQVERIADKNIPDPTGIQYDSQKCISKAFVQTVGVSQIDQMTKTQKSSYYIQPTTDQNRMRLSIEKAKTANTKNGEHCAECQNLFVADSMVPTQYW